MIETYKVPNLTPQEIVERLNEHIIGQDEAKKRMAIALRNRHRRASLDATWQEEISPSNIIMMGPTGVGKTEIARRLAKMIGAPFVKVEATKFTEVGYVGRDVEAMVRDLAEASYRLVHATMKEEVQEEALRRADERLLEVFVPEKKRSFSPSMANPMEFFTRAFQEEEENPEEARKLKDKRAIYREKLKRQELEDDTVEIEVEPRPTSTQMMEQTGMDQVMGDLNDMMQQIAPSKKKKRRVTVAQARLIFAEEEAEKLIDDELVKNQTIFLAENHGIIFIDEIDKIARKNAGHGPDVSGQGVQRDILPIVEGSVVKTKYGPLRTDHVLFIAAGAFHVSRPEDLIPELQGRFPIKVHLDNLTEEDFYKILTETLHPLPEQYRALLAVDGVDLVFDESGLRALAKAAHRANMEDENLGARRLITIFETVLEDALYQVGTSQVVIDEALVQKKLSGVFKEVNPAQYIL